MNGLCKCALSHLVLFDRPDPEQALRCLHVTAYEKPYRMSPLCASEGEQLFELLSVDTCLHVVALHV